MKCLYNMWFLEYFILICRACFVCFMGSLYIEASERPLTTSHPFNYTRLVKKCLKLMKLIWDQAKTIDAGSMFRRLGHLNELPWFMGSQSSPPAAKHWHIETFRNSYDIMKPRLLKSRDFGSLIRARTTVSKQLIHKSFGASWSSASKVPITRM